MTDSIRGPVGSFFIFSEWLEGSISIDSLLFAVGVTNGSVVSFNVAKPLVRIQGLPDREKTINVAKKEICVSA